MENSIKKKQRKSSAVRLYFHYISIQIRCMMQYKKSFIMTSLGQFLASFNAFIGIHFMFRRFHSIAGYTYSDVLLCFSLITMEFSLCFDV